MPKQRGWLGTYLLVGSVWGCSFLFIALSNQFLTPIGVAFWRQLLGAIPMVLLAWFAKKKFPTDVKTWALVFCVSIFMNSAPSVLFAYAERHVSSAFAGIMNATTPITTLIMILSIFREEKPARQVFVGLFVGLLGVATVLEVWNGFGTNDASAVLALCLATLMYGIGGPFARRYVTSLKLEPQVQVAMQISMAAITLTPFYLFQPLVTAVPTWSGLAGIVLLGVVGTGFTYIWYYKLMATAGSAVANAVTFMSPVVAVLAGAALLGESVSIAQLLGGAVVILGAAISQGRLNGLWARVSGSARK